MKYLSMLMLAAVLLLKSCGAQPPPVVVVHGAQLSWNVPDAGITEYRIYRSDASGGPYTLLISVVTTSWLDSDAKSGSTHFYILTDVSGGFESVHSNEVAITVP